jgi:DNA helicase-2/ATP-dependent DNA helicase PcrA
MKLTEGQLTASHHYTGPALTLAIPGSGKTTLLLHRLQSLNDIHGIGGEQILTLTFSKASAEDMASRCEALFGASPYAFMTIHRFAYGLFRQWLKASGKQMRLLESGKERFALFSNLYTAHYHFPMSEDDYEALQAEIGLIYNLRLTRADYRADRFQFDKIFDIASDYHRLKRKNGLYDFDDMLLYALRLLDGNPRLVQSIQRRYPFIQVDEAQDTSKLQFELIERLIGPEKNLFLVADDDQSIYGFRGAYPDYLLNFGKKFPDAAFYYLSENFRSGAPLIRSAEHIIGENEKRFKKPMKAANAGGIPPEVKYFDDLTARNAYLLQTLKENIHPEETVAKETDADPSLAILYRNRMSALSVVDSLLQNGIEFKIKDPPIGELSHWILKDILAFMTLAMIPQDRDSLERIAYKMNAFISKEMLTYVQTTQVSRSVFDVLVEIPFLKDFQTRTQESVRNKFEALARLRPYDAIHFIETDLGYLDYVQHNAQRLGISMQFARTRLDAYKAIAKPLKSGLDFIERIDVLSTAMTSIQRTGDAPLTLSTIHGVKGLEFDSVFLIDVNTGVFPGPRSDSGDALEEERRLFYVALTRARHRFELLHIHFVCGAFNGDSRFIEELIRVEHPADDLG